MEYPFDTMLESPKKQQLNMNIWWLLEILLTVAAVTSEFPVSGINKRISILFYENWPRLCLED